MMSRHAAMLSLLLGAFALIVVLTGIFVIRLSEISTGKRVTIVPQSAVSPGSNLKPPRFAGTVTATDAIIAEIGPQGETIRVVYSSSLRDNVADFSLFAVPQEHYAGKIYVVQIGDEKLGILQIFPLDVLTGTIEIPVLSVPFDSYLLSENQETVIVTKDGVAQIYSLLL